MVNNPLVSVIVPCYNHDKYIEECLLSILNQSYSNIELIVIDDGSSDNSVQIINNIKANNNFIFEVQQNSGISSTLNKGIKKYANGKYVAIIASDDAWHTDKIKIQVEFLENNPKFAMVCSNTYIIDENSNVLTSNHDNLFIGNYSFKEIAFGQCLIPALTVLINKDVFEKVGFFDEKLLIEDMDMWLRIADAFKIGVIKEKLTYYRKHATNVSLRSIEMSKSRFKILEKWKHLPAKTYKKIERNWELVALNELWNLYPDEAKKYCNPTLKKLLNSAYLKYTIKYFIRYILKFNLR